MLGSPAIEFGVASEPDNQDPLKPQSAATPAGTATDGLRNWILSDEIFDPGMYSLGHTTDHLVLHIPELRRWPDAAIDAELGRMLAEGLVTKHHRHWSSTHEGQVARERAIQAARCRAACLCDQDSHAIDDLALAIVAHGHEEGIQARAATDDTLKVYLHRRGDECAAGINRLASARLITVHEHFTTRGARGLYPTGAGMRHLEDVVRARLSLPGGVGILEMPPLETTSPPSPYRELEFIEHLADGGFAGVWRARDPILVREVAVKVFRPTEVEISGALEHARALAKVNHPNVVIVHEVVRVRDPHAPDHIVDAVVMELINDETLGDRLRGARFDLDQAKRVGLGILDGIEAVHAAGIAHGDLHEGNVMLHRQAGAKVIDILYRGTLATLPTATRELQHARDLGAVRELLGLILQHSVLEFGAGFLYRQRLPTTVRSTDIRKAFLDSFDLAAPALQEARTSSATDIDRHVATRFWRVINSAWLRNWRETRCSYPQYEEALFIHVFQQYLRLPDQPEFQFADATLAARHGALVAAIGEYCRSTAVEMVNRGTRGEYVISTKAAGEQRWIEDYDAEYQRQVGVVEAGLSLVWETWGAYVRLVNASFPAVTDDQSFPPLGHQALALAEE